MNKDITMREAGVSFLARCEKKHKPATFKTFSSHVRNIESFMGRRPVREISNGALRDFAAHLSDAWSCTDKRYATSWPLPKSIVESCVDAERVITSIL